MKMITNNVPRDIIYGYELTEDERKEFDYLDWNPAQEDAGAAWTHEFFRYKGQVYDLGEFVGSPRNPALSEWGPWDGIQTDTFFSATVVRFVDDNERVIVGRIYS